MTNMPPGSTPADFDEFDGQRAPDIMCSHGKFWDEPCPECGEGEEDE